MVDALRAVGPLLPPSDRIPASAGALRPLLPDLADRLPPHPASAGDGLPGRHLLVQAVRALLGALGDVVLVIEDLHWVDDATRELLLLLARDMPPGLALVLTYRAEDLPPDTPALGAAYRRPAGVGGALIRLNPLAETEVHDLARAALGPRATPALTRVLFDRSEGLPLVAEEDLITLCEQRGGSGLTDAADLAADLEHSEVPRGLRDAVTERLAGLSADASAVAAAAAVLGVPAGEELLAAVSGLDRQATADGLTEALRRPCSTRTRWPATASGTSWPSRWRTAGCPGRSAPPCTGGPSGRWARASRGRWCRSPTTPWRSATGRPGRRWPRPPPTRRSHSGTAAAPACSCTGCSTSPTWTRAAAAAPRSRWPGSPPTAWTPRRAPRR
ncbi:hypothetical protein ACFQ0M_44540 [Kitasatospora aburaviensis]